MNKANLSERIVRYEYQRARGHGAALEHEVLYEQIRAAYGPMTAAFFDKEHTLPYATTPHLPWPMKPYSAHTFMMVRLMLVVAGGFAAAAVSSYVGITGMWWIVAAMIGAAAIYVLTTFLPKLTRPRDYELRECLVQEFRSMQHEHYDRAEREATSRRDGRILRELEERE